MKPENYHDLFERRDESDENHVSWLNESVALLEAHLASVRGDIGAAAKNLVVEGWKAKELGELAYASFCFWHLPLADSAAMSKEGDVHYRANVALSALINQPCGPADQDRLARVNWYLDLASVALQARTKVETTQVVFHEKLFGCVMQSLAEDATLHEKTEKWPLILDQNGRPLAGMCEKGNLSGAVVQKIVAQDPSALAEKVSGYMVQAAKELSPDLYGDFPLIKPTVYVASEEKTPPPSGSYNLITKTYNLHCESLYAFSTLPRFVSCCLHETLHLLQFHAAAKEGGNSGYLFFGEARAYRQSLSGVSRDQPLMFYPVAAQGEAAMPANEAYVSRPSEALAHSFGAAVEQVLDRAWNLPRGGRLFDPDVSNFTKIADDLRLFPQTPNTRAANSSVRRLVMK